MRYGTNHRARRGANRSEPIVLFIKRNKTIFTLCMLFLIGIAFGAYAVRTLDENTLKGLLSIVGGFVNARQTATLSQMLMASLTQNLILIIVLFFCGYCAISAPVIYIIPVFKGLGYGITSGAMLSYYGMNALPFIGLLILPNTVLSALILVLACKESLIMSRNFLSVIKSVELERGEQITSSGKYCVKFMLFLLAIIVGAFIESYSFFISSGIWGL